MELLTRRDVFRIAHRLSKFLTSVFVPGAKIRWNLHFGPILPGEATSSDPGYRDALHGHLSEEGGDGTECRRSWHRANDPAESGGGGSPWPAY
jgi:hypothetical protein